MVQRKMAKATMTTMVTIRVASTTLFIYVFRDVNLRCQLKG